MILYHIGAIIKLLLGCVTILLIYNYVDPKLDPGIALGFGFLGLFIFIRGLSFYIFYSGYIFFSEKNAEICAKESYKMSLLFGIFVLLNVSLLFLEYWTRVLGFLMFIAFCLLQIFLLYNFDEHDSVKEF